MSEIHVWTAVGILGGVLFYGRFFVQWLVSELRKQSVIPLAFWYMSASGTVLLLGYAVRIQSPLGALGQCFNIVVYTRNIVHIWRSRGTVSPIRIRAIQVVVGLGVLVALGLVVLTWYREYEITSAAPADEAIATWGWLAVGVAGQALFALRFLVQWVATEMRRKSVVPTVFWYLSVVAATLQTATFIQRAEWVFAVGLSCTILIYLRNLWFIHTHPDRSETTVLLR